jgi:glycosyltransferase involved in cell wall biosynthesis
MLKHDSLAIAAIFRDEYDYLIEWFAWHQIAGFKKFFIADNGSTDGTVALLEALGDLGIVELIYQPVLAKRAQLVAYQRLSQAAISHGVECLLFIDADEFLVHDSMIDGEEYECLLRLFDDPRVVMVGINWRTFGSSGQKKQVAEPVVSRFTKCCGEMELSRNGPLKSISRIPFMISIGPHVGVGFPGYKSVDVNGVNLSGFVMYANGHAIDVEFGSALRVAIDTPLRVNHYVIKSEQEFVEKKRKRGDAMRGIDFDHGMAYFSNHDFNDASLVFPVSKLDRLKLEMEYLHLSLESTTFFRKLRGALDLSNPMDLRGWLVDENKQSAGLKINIFVNEMWQARVSCGFYRPDLKEKNISKSGLSGFRYTHPKPLSPGDVVEVKVHANRYVFPARSRVVIE